MGHDIAAIKDLREYNKFWNGPSIETDTKKFRKKNEIAYLRRNMWSSTIHEFYNAICCGKYDAGVSGNGGHNFVSLLMLKHAMFYVVNNLEGEDEEDYRDFLDKCIVYCEKNKKRGVTILFN